MSKNRFPNDLWLCDKWNIGNFTFLQFKHKQLQEKAKMVSTESPQAPTITTSFDCAEPSISIFVFSFDDVLNTKGLHHTSLDTWTRNHGAHRKIECIKIPSYQPSKRAVLRIIDPRLYHNVQKRSKANIFPSRSRASQALLVSSLLYGTQKQKKIINKAYGNCPIVWQNPRQEITNQNAQIFLTTYNKPH